MRIPSQSDPAIAEPAVFSGIAMKSANIIGINVVNPLKEDVGNVENIVINVLTGRIVYALLSFGGVLGLGEKLYATTWKALRFDKEIKVCVFNANRDQIELAPSFDKESWPNLRTTGTGLCISFTTLYRNGLCSGTVVPKRDVQPLLAFRLPPRRSRLLPARGDEFGLENSPDLVVIASNVIKITSHRVVRVSRFDVASIVPRDRVVAQTDRPTHITHLL